VSVDWRLWCELYRLSSSPIWQVDAHPNIQFLAAKVGVTPNTVWKRLTEWRRLGFIERHVFFPNPRLLGVGLEFSSVGIPSPAYRQAFLDKLDLVDGVIVAQSSHGAPTTIMTIADSPSSISRRREVIRAIPGVETLTHLFPVWLPSPTNQLRIKDYRLISALRTAPTASFAKLGSSLGVSARTFARRLKALRATYGLLTVRVEDFSRFPGAIAVLTIEIQPSVNSRTVAARIEKVAPDLLEVPSMSQPPYRPHTRLNYVGEFSNVSVLEDLSAEFSKIEGIAGVTSRFPGRERVYDNWFDNRIHQILNSPAD
jgi:DNA-binding Lrp family transcriptional regulator